MREVLRSDWSGVFELMECFLEISWHGNVHYAGHILPVKCDYTVKTTCPILCYLIFFLECIYEVLGILSSLVSDSKVVNH